MRLVSLIILAMLALGSCGVKGPLEAPPGSSAPEEAKKKT